MSTAAAIAASTRVLTAVIDRAVANSGFAGLLGSPPYLTTKSPDQLESGDEAAQLALFLYHVTHNQGWRQVGLPSRSGDSAVVDRPPLALDLHYLLIAYGDSEYIPQLLLGLGMQALHETPVLNRQEIAAVFTPPPPLSPLDTVLATADISNQVELIKTTPEPLSADDLSRLWTAFGGKFRPSAGYAVTTLLIESTAAVAAAPPVASRNIAVLQLRQPIVTAVTPQFLPWSPAPNLMLAGVNLNGPDVAVVFDRNPAAPQTPLFTGPTTSEVAVPALPAGLNTLRVVQHIAAGTPPVTHVVQSDAALFHLQPVVRQSATPPNDDLIDTAPATADGIPVTVHLDPVLTDSQKVQLLLNEAAPADGVPLSFTIEAAPTGIAANAVTFVVAGVPSGRYLVRVRVDGVESVLRPDPVSHEYARPAVTL